MISPGIVLLIFLLSVIFGLGFTFIIETYYYREEVKVNDILYIPDGERVKPVRVRSIKITELITVYETVDGDGKKHTFMQSQIGKDVYQSEYEALKHIN